MNVVLSFFKFGEFTMIVCPKCRSDKFYYKMRVWEFHVVDNIDDGKVELLDLYDSYIDLSMNPFFQCDDCGTEFSTEEINQVVNLNKEN